jgi:Sep-tRNA:Cys-tRNA synthetase
LQQYEHLKRDFSEERYINLNPIQRGGVLTEAARKALLEFGDGYSVCDWCPPKAARIDMIKRPPVYDFLEDLAKFLNMDVARIVAGCRGAKLIAFSMLSETGDYVVVDSLAHYSTYLAAEAVGLRIKEVPHSGYPEYKVNVEGYAEKIEEVKQETGKMPTVVLLTHVDYLYGNLNHVEVVGKICKEYGVPLLLNAAYTAGVMPVDGEALGVDILVGSGHKSWAASGPTGILAMTEEMADKILVRSKIVGDWSKRKFPEKELGMLGCTNMGTPLLTLMASFPNIVKRVQHWGEEIKKARYLTEQMKRIKDTKQLGIKPKQHTLINMETPGFYSVSESHKRRGFFLYNELKERKIVGIQAGLTKHFKFNTYGLSWDQIRYVANAFQEIAQKYGLTII